MSAINLSTFCITTTWYAPKWVCMILCITQRRCSKKGCNFDNQDFFFLSMLSNSACHSTSMWIACHLPAILLTEKNMYEKMKKIFGFILVYMQPQSIFARHFWETLCFVIMGMLDILAIARCKKTCNAPPHIRSASFPGETPFGRKNSNRSNHD